MKVFIFLLLMMPLYAEAESELICEPEARITFQDRWLRGSIVKLESALSWEMPWTGREATVSGLVLRNERLREFTSNEAAANDELLSLVPEEAHFISYKDKQANVLSIDRALLEQGEHDGIVIARSQEKVSIFHCRSR